MTPLDAGRVHTGECFDGRCGIHAFVLHEVPADDVPGPVEAVRAVDEEQFASMFASEPYHEGQASLDFLLGYPRARAPG